MAGGCSDELIFDEWGNIEIEAETAEFPKSAPQIQSACMRRNMS